MMRPHRSRYVADVLFAVGLTAMALVDLAQLRNELAGIAQQVGLRPVDGWAVVTNLAMTIPLIWRRRIPTAILAIVFGAFVADRMADYPATLGIFALAFAFHAVGSDLPTRRSVRVGAIGIGLAIAFTAFGAIDPNTEHVGWTEVVSIAAITVAPWALGREIHSSRAAGRRAEDRAREVEASRAAALAKAVQDERTRIARELHDVVAHQITVMTLQAGAARRQLETDRAKATNALEAIETSGREGMTEMRRLLDLLRPEDDTPALEPQPGLARLDDLVAQMTDAGVDVQLVVEGAPRELPTGVELNAYRIIQESLTNTLKHGGPAARATVTLTFEDEALGVEVVDTGRGAASSIDAANNGTGLGLVGMRERVALLNGTLVAGPRRGGGFRVAAQLPAPAR